MKTSNEIWKPVVGFEGLYEVSNKGRIRNRKGRILRFFKNREYLKIELSNNGKTKKLYVHRLVAEAFIPNYDSTKNIINHKDENPGNNCVENLEWCDYKYNLNYGNAQKNRLISRYGKVA